MTRPRRMCDCEPSHAASRAAGTRVTRGTADRDAPRGPGRRPAPRARDLADSVAIQFCSSCLSFTCLSGVYFVAIGAASDTTSATLPEVHENTETGRNGSCRMLFSSFNARIILYISIKVQPVLYPIWPRLHTNRKLCSINHPFPGQIPTQLQSNSYIKYNSCIKR